MNDEEVKINQVKWEPVFDLMLLKENKRAIEV